MVERLSWWSWLVLSLAAAAGVLANEEACPTGNQSCIDEYNEIMRLFNENDEELAENEFLLKHMRRLREGIMDQELVPLPWALRNEWMENEPNVQFVTYDEDHPAALDWQDYITEYNQTTIPDVNGYIIHAKLLPMRRHYVTTLNEPGAVLATVDSANIIQITHPGTGKMLDTFQLDFTPTMMKTQASANEDKAWWKKNKL